MISRICLAIVLPLLSIAVRPAAAQMIHTVVPMQNIGSSFHQSSSVNGSIVGPNWFANFGGRGPLLPPFGGAGVGGGLSGGLAFGGGGLSGNLGFNFSQGSSQSISSTSASLTTMDGEPGSIQATVIRPFVTGVTPIVGDYQQALAPLNRAAAEAELRGQYQFQQLRQSQATLQQRKLAQYLRRAEQAEADGNTRMARANYRSAIAIAAEPLRTHLQMRLRALMQRSAQRR